MAVAQVVVDPFVTHPLLYQNAITTRCNRLQNIFIRQIFSVRSG